MTVTEDGPRRGAALARVLNAPLRALDSFGRVTDFNARAFVMLPKAVKSYKKEQIRIIAETGMGSGALAVIGGAVAISAFITFFTGATAGVQAYQALSEINLQALNGFAAAFVVTRLAVPLLVGAGMTATVGAGFTAQLGAMRINEEIDALESMGVRSLPYLVSTRVLAGFIAAIPLYAASLVLSYLGYEMVVVVFYHQSIGAYNHYFSTFLQPADILYSFVQGLAMAVVVMLVHCYYGYNASGGPAGVGEAVGKAVRTSLIGVTMVNLAVALALYGGGATFRISG
jgi:phospholipid/cholesterol/gamma-HCH transport system permease protein